MTEEFEKLVAEFPEFIKALEDMTPIMRALHKKDPERFHAIRDALMEKILGLNTE